jgi:hypothetical protein
LSVTACGPFSINNLRAAFNAAARLSSGLNRFFVVGIYFYNSNSAAQSEHQDAPYRYHLLRPTVHFRHPIVGRGRKQERWWINNIPIATAFWDRLRQLLRDQWQRTYQAGVRRGIARPKSRTKKGRKFRPFLCQQRAQRLLGSNRQCINRNILPAELALMEDHAATLKREQGVILAHADVATRIHLGAALTDDDVAGNDFLATELLDAQTTSG